MQRKNTVVRRVLRLWARAVVVLAFLPLVDASAARAAESARETCAVPDDMEFSDAALPHVAAKLTAGEPVQILVIGSGSSAGMGASKAENAYPERLPGDLGRLFPKAQFVVANLSKRGQLATEMERRLATEVVAKNPALVIWQTGTVEAVRGIDVGSFAQTLSDGIDLLEGHNADVILMNMQYSPHSSTALNVGAYRDYMRWVATSRSIILFDRYAIMKYWEEEGVIDFSDPSKAEQTRADDFVHGCVAMLLAEMIDAGVKAAGEAKP